MIEYLSNVTTAINLASRLREIGKNIEDAEFKNLLADLSIELADAKLKIADLISKNTKLKEELHAFTSSTGEICPKCKSRTFEIVSTKPDKIFGDMGAKEREYKCSVCEFTETKFIDP